MTRRLGVGRRQEPGFGSEQGAGRARREEIAYMVKRGVWKEVDVKEVLGEDEQGTDHDQVGRH